MLEIAMLYYYLQISFIFFCLQAYQKLYKLQLEEEKEQKARLENEKKKQQDFADKVRRILEAAFDGSVLEIKEILSQVSCIPYHKYKCK